MYIFLPLPLEVVLVERRLQVGVVTREIGDFSVILMYGLMHLVDLLFIKGLNYTITKTKENICTCFYLYHVEMWSLEDDLKKELLRGKLEIFSSYERSYKQRI